MHVHTYMHKFTARGKGDDYRKICKVQFTNKSNIAQAEQVWSHLTRRIKAECNAINVHLNGAKHTGQRYATLHGT